MAGGWMTPVVGRTAAQKRALKAAQNAIGLSQQERTVLRLYCNDLSVRQVASVYNRTYEAVKRSISDARFKLRKQGYMVDSKIDLLKLCEVGLFDE
jgi:DNA-directed RNA polymerase specialized sigma24 family protein